MKTREWISTILALAAVIGAFTLPFWYEGQRREAFSKAHTIVLTGIAPQGIWTEDEVTGANYSKGGFKPAQIRLKAGEQIHLVLRSADVVHSFYMPELGVGPIQLIPGHTEEVNFKADKEGAYPFYCTSVCGDCHFHMLNMRGLVAVGKEIPAAAPALDEPLCRVNVSSEMPAFTDITRKGRFLFQTRGCITCHGADGAGGVPNFNYARGTVPALNTLANKMSLESKEEADAFVKALDQKAGPSKDSPAPGVSNWTLSFAQYQSVVKTIEGGSQPLKADPKGPEPPLFMPRWKEVLDRDQINAIIAYLVSQQKFVEHTGWGM